MDKQHAVDQIPDFIDSSDDDIFQRIPSQAERESEERKTIIFSRGNQPPSTETESKS